MFCLKSVAFCQVPLEPNERNLYFQAAVIIGGKLRHVIQKVGLTPGQHAEHLTTESWLWAETSPNYCLTFSKKEIKPFRSNRDLPTRTKSLQQINSHLFITEYLPPCSNVKSWNIFHLGKIARGCFAEKGWYAYSSLTDAMGHPVCALLSKTKTLKQSFLFAAAGCMLSSSHEGLWFPLTLLDFQGHFVGRHREKLLLCLLPSDHVQNQLH